MQKIMSLRVIYLNEKHVDHMYNYSTLQAYAKLLKDHHAIMTFIPSNK